MKNFYKVRGKREFLFDDKELLMLGGGALIICGLIFILGFMVGQTLQEQSVASTLVAENYPGDITELAENEIPPGETTRPENRAQDVPGTSPSGSKKTLQRSYYQVLPDSETYVEVKATPGKQSDSELTSTQEPQQVKPEEQPPGQTANAETPIPPATTPAAISQPQGNTLVSSLPNVPKDASDEIQFGRQSGSIGINTPPNGTIYSVQVASSVNREDSENLVRKYGERGYQAYIMVADLAEKGIWYRVRVGNLATREDAKRFREEILSTLPDLANDPFVIKVTE